MYSYSGNTLDEALAAAAEEKNCKVEDLTYFVKEGVEEGVIVDAYCEDDVKEFLFDYIGTFFTDMDQDIEVGLEYKDECYIVRLNSENNASLIGHMGRTLAAFNTIVKAAANNEFRKHIDVLIDVNNYKEDRYRKLRGLAKRTAIEVQKSHVDVELDPMPNDERKVIHKYLSSWKNISTESSGQGRDRHLCIRYSEEAAPETATEDEAE